MAIKTELRSDKRCVGCTGPDTTTAPVVRYYGNGTTKWAHPVCMGVWLMQNPEESVCFEPGEVA